MTQICVMSLSIHAVTFPLGTKEFKMRVNFFNQSGSTIAGISNGLTGTMTGPLILAADPVNALEAVTKRYVDSKVASLSAASLTSGILPVSRFPSFSGDLTSAAGTGTFTLSTTGVTAGTYTKVTVNAKGRVTAGSSITNNDIPTFSWSKITSDKPTTLAGYGITDGVSASGGTLAGLIKLSNDPTSALHAVTKQYADTVASQNTSTKPGDIVRRPSTTAQPGYLRANGSYVSKSTYATLYSSLGKNEIITLTMDHTSHAALGEGRPWANQSAFKTMDLAELNNWFPGTALPETRAAARFVVVGKYVHCIGGFINSSLTVTRNVLSARINSDGTIGNWVTSPNLLATGVARATAFVVKNTLFVCGGVTDATGSSTNAVQRCAIAYDGSLGTWSYSGGGIMTSACSDGEAIVTKNRVYIFGGMAVKTYTYSNLIHTAPIDSSGNVGSWSQSTTLPQNVGFGVAVTVVKNNVYLFCKADNSAGKAATIFKAPLNSDGTIGSWVTTGITIPFSPQRGSLIATKTRLYYIGGTSNDDISLDTNMNHVYSISVNSDGSLGTWTQGPNLPYKSVLGEAVLIKDKLHLLGGFENTVITSGSITTSVPGKEMISDYSHFYDGTINTFSGTSVSGTVTIQGEVDANFTMPGNGKPWQQQYQINQLQGGELNGWVSGTNLVEARGWSDSVLVTNKFVYLLGGGNGVSRGNPIQRAPINGDGTLGAWSANGTIPVGLSDIATIVTKNRVYVIGGQTDTPSYANPTITTATYTAPINADGTLGAWTTGPVLPAGLSHTKAVVTKNRVYAISGWTTGAVTNVIYTAIINADGTLGSWSTAGSVPVGLVHSSLCVAKNKVYLLAGHTRVITDSLGQNNVVYVADINADGTIGAFTTNAPATPEVLYGATSFTTGTDVYLIGGTGASGTVVKKVWRSSFYADGSLMGWVACTDLPTVRTMHNLAVLKDYVYLLGGYDGSVHLTSTIYAPIQGGLNDYSSYYDGTIEPTDAGKFYLPDYSDRENTYEYYFVKT